MARTGDELVNPVTGLRTVFRQTSDETGGELLRVVFGPLAALGRMAGYRPDYPYRRTPAERTLESTA